jgi:hypothetical protein
MQDSLLRTLRAHRPAIRARWEALLRIEKINTPLANPDTLIYLFDRTLDQVFAELRHPHPPGRGEMETPGSEKNPLVNYFVAGEQAILEALVLAQAELPTLEPRQRDADFSQLKRAVHGIAQREIGTLESVCQHRPPYAGAGI